MDLWMYLDHSHPPIFCLIAVPSSASSDSSSRKESSMQSPGLMFLILLKSSKGNQPVLYNLVFPDVMSFIDFSFAWIVVSLLYLNSQKAGIICYVFYGPKGTSCSRVHEGSRSGRGRSCLQVPLWIPTLKSRYETASVSWNQHPKKTNERQNILLRIRKQH